MNPINHEDSNVRPQLTKGKRFMNNRTMKLKATSQLARRLTNSVFAIIASTLAITTSPIYAGHGVGTGGDHIRGTFIRVGLSVASYLETTDRGQAIVARHNLSLAELSNTLNIDTIDVTDEVLIDNTGSVVDAIGVPGRITLSRDAWLEHFELERDVYFLVFHEMLRAVAVNDDNYVISMAINPFPATRRITTKIQTTFPLLGEVSLDSMIGAGKILVEGNGCPSSLGGTFVDLDIERNQVGLSFQRYDLTLGKLTSGRKACTLVLPIRPPQGSRVVVTQSDFSVKVISKSAITIAAAQNVTLGNRLVSPSIKSVTTKAGTQGRLLVRTNNLLTSNCQGTPELLKVSTSLTANLPQSVGQQAASVIGEHVLLSLRVESCPSSLH